MKHYIQIIKQHKKESVVAIIIIVSIIVLAIILFFPKNSSNNEDTESDVISSPLDGDSEISQSVYDIILESNAQRYFIEGDKTAVPISSTVMYSRLNSGGTKLEFDKIRFYTELESLEWFNKLHNPDVYVSDNNKYYLVIEYLDNVIKTMYLYMPVSEDKEEDDHQTEEQQKNSSVSLYVEFADENVWYIKEPKGNGHFYVWAKGLANAQCTAYAISQNNGAKTIANSPYNGVFSLPNPGGNPEVISFYLPVGKHDAFVNCKLNGENYSTSAVMEMIAIPTSM